MLCRLDAGFKNLQGKIGGIFVTSSCVGPTVRRIHDVIILSGLPSGFRFSLLVEETSHHLLLILNFTCEIPRANGQQLPIRWMEPIKIQTEIPLIVFEAFFFLFFSRANFHCNNTLFSLPSSSTSSLRRHYYISCCVRFFEKR